MKHNRMMITLFIILAIDAMNFGLVIPMLPKLFLGPHALLADSLMNATQAYTLMGLVLGVYPLAVCLATPLLGIASDRFGRKPILFASLLGTGLSLFASAFAISLKSVGLLIFARACTGIWSASQPIAQAAVADISRADKRPVYFSMVAFAMTLGMLAGPLLGGFFKEPFIIAGFLALANFVFMVFAYKETLPESAYRVTSFATYLNLCKANLVKPSFLRLMALFFLLELAWSLFFQTEPLLLAQFFNYSSQMQSIYITYLGLVMCVGLAIVFPWWVKRMPLPRIISLCFLANAFGFFLLLFLHNQLSLWLAAIPFTLGVGMAYTGIVSLLSLLISEKEQGWLMGFTSALLALAWAITGLIGAKLFYYHFGLPIGICFSMAAIAVFLIALY
jgi:MFS family permease